MYLSILVPVLSKSENHIQTLIPHFNCIHKPKLLVCPPSKWNDAIKPGLLSTML